MLRENIIVGYLNSLKGNSSDVVIKRLTELGDSVSSGEKNTIYSYLFPGNLFDGELAEQYKAAGGGGYKGKLEPSEVDIPLLMNAYGSRQYRGYIRHLLHTFVNAGEQDLFLLDSDEVTECGLCKVGVHGLKSNPPDKSHLAYGSQRSSVLLCPTCLFQLHILHDLLRKIEGDNYLIWGNVIGRL